MYPPPQPEQARYQAKLLVNMVVLVFLIIGLLLVLQYFNFIYLRDIPVIGNWLMDTYERVFGVPQVLILHGDDSLGDWTALQLALTNKMIFYSEDIDVRKFTAGLGAKLNQYDLVIVEDALTIDKDKLVNLDSYVKGGGNLIWVGDAGTRGEVHYEGEVIANQTGWFRGIVCVDSVTMKQCNCTLNKTASCKFLPESADGGAAQMQEDFTGILGMTFIKDIVGTGATMEIVDNDHWAATGIKYNFPLNVSKITSVSNSMATALVANINISNKVYPGLVVNDPPGSWGNIVFFAYPPEETPEILLPLVQRLRY
jgi:hypothetical protein